MHLYSSRNVAIAGQVVVDQCVVQGRVGGE